MISGLLEEKKIQTNIVASKNAQYGRYLLAMMMSYYNLHVNMY
jgi:hypothetical protein